MNTHRYQLVVTGRLGAAARDAFGDVDIDYRDKVTVLSGDFDQAALFGAIHRVQHFALELVEITRVSAPARVTAV